MKIVYAYFKGYIGFFNGMGLEELEIDLSKCKHNIVLIVGKNGSGKSTLQGALNIFPDNNSCFRNGINAQKRLKIIDGDNIYDIHIDYPVDASGKRKTTKAFLAKNGEELNPNGNVTSYKDLLSTEFDLDPNFVALSVLTSIDRGLGDKRPAERKKFVGSVMENLNTYNNIYKTLNKKSLIYKSHVNTIHTKIQSTGDLNALESTLSQLQLQEKSVEDKILSINNQIVSIQAKNSTNEKEVEMIQELIKSKSIYDDELESINSQLGSYMNKTKIEKEDIENVLEENRNLLSSYEDKLNAAKQKLQENSDRLANVTSNIHQMEVTLQEANQSIDNTLEERYKKSNELISSITNDILSLGLEADTSKIQEFTDIIEFSRNFIQKLDAFYDGLTLDQVKSITIDYDPFRLKKLQQESETIVKDIEASKEKILQCNEDLKTLSVLDDRPSNCNIQNCPFISSAIKISKSKTKDSIVEDLNGLQEKISKLSYDLTKNQDEIQIWNSMIPKRMEYGTLTELFENILSKYPENNLTNSSYENFENKVSKLYAFNSLRDLSNYIEGLNDLIQLRDEIQKNEIIKISYQSHRDKIKLINSTNVSIDNLKKEQEELNESIIKCREEIHTFDDLSSSLRSNIGIQELYTHAYQSYQTIQSNRMDIQQKLDEFEKKSAESLEALAQIDRYKGDLIKAQEELEPIKQSITDVSGRLTLLQSYMSEYNTYNDSYQIIETLKKYCSPTGGGIQTIFMQLYMSKTLELSNQILSMLFNGEYQLIDFIINDREFRIPFIGNGLTVDDISSGSNSQVCMMGMVINLVLLHQASTKYNIAYLDEIDAGLDHRNRFEFVSALYKTIPLLNIDQLFMISHSMETDTSSVDIIKLKGYEDFEDTVQMGNVIFDYKEVV